MTIKDDPSRELTRGPAWLAIGGLIGALTASACCIVPLMLFGLGVSGAWIANLTRLAPYQPCVIAATFVCLGGGYWLVYRASRKDCREGAACTRRLPGRLVITGLVIATVLVIAALAFDALAPIFSHHERRQAMTKVLAAAALGFGLLASSTAFAAERTVTLAVKNMYCAACPHIVKASLEAVPGVTKTVVSSRDHTAIVTYDDVKTDVKALTAATANAGYPSAPKS